MTIREELFGGALLSESAPSIIRGIHVADGVSRIELHGEVDLSSCDQLRDALVEAAEAPDIVLDLTAVRYMDSSAFGILLSTTRVLKPLGGVLHLVGCNAHIARMLVVTRLDTMLCVHDGSEDGRDCRVTTTPRFPRG